MCVRSRVSGTTFIHRLIMVLLTPRLRIIYSLLFPLLSAIDNLFVLYVIPFIDEWAGWNLKFLRPKPWKGSRGSCPGVKVVPVNVIWGSFILQLVTVVVTQLCYFFRRCCRYLTPVETCFNKDQQASVTYLVSSRAKTLQHTL